MFLTYLDSVRLNKPLTSLLLLLLTVAPQLRGFAQSPFAGLEPLFTQPRQYTTFFTRSAPTIDGNITDAAWAAAPWTDFFVDIEGDEKPLPAFRTRVKMLWNDTCLFIAAELEEPHVWATLKNHDDIVFHDNDFEVFLDPQNTTHQYYEVEVNALNTIFDLYLAKPYRNGSGALITWHLNQLRTAVQVQGSLNNPSDTDQGWTVEMAIPFRSVTLGNHANVPQEGTLWRVNFSRVQWETEVVDGRYVKKKDLNGRPLPEHNWVWSPQGLINMHYPERWGYLHFTRREPDSQPAAPALPFAEKQKPYLWLVYYKQKEYLRKHGHYATSLAQLGVKNKGKFRIEGQLHQLRIEATSRQFMTFIQGPDKEVWSIDQDGLVRKQKKS